jgi:hypothetical protein
VSTNLSDQRTTPWLIYLLAAISVVLLAPYFGIHILFTSPPDFNDREVSGSAVSPRAPQGVAEMIENTGDEQMKKGAGSGLSDIEQLLAQ